mgnify:CR=1 FL=1
MRELNANMLYFAKGGMILDGRPESSNVTDLRGNDQGSYIDANGACWMPGTSSIIMYPSGGNSGFNWGSSSSTSGVGGGS